MTVKENITIDINSINYLFNNKQYNKCKKTIDLCFDRYNSRSLNKLLKNLSNDIIEFYCNN